MIITGKRIRTLARHLTGVQDGREIIIGLTDIDRFDAVLRQVGFADNAAAGDTVLPAALGPVSTYNAEGKEVAQKDQPKETAYRQREWHWQEWHGRYNRVDQSKIVDVPYERYPRVFHAPPSVELTIANDPEGNRIIVTETVAFVAENKEEILHRVNLLLELFGECNVMDSDLDSITHTRIRRVNWTILPQGRMPWNRLKGHLRLVIERQPEGNRPVIEHRLESVNAYQPQFVAVGRAGFDGYVIFGFPNRNIYILESARYGNATYVFGENWEALSQRTKADILDENLHQARLIHRDGWDEELRGLFTVRRSA